MGPESVRNVVGHSSGGSFPILGGGTIYFAGKDRDGPSMPVVANSN